MVYDRDYRSDMWADIGRLYCDNFSWGWIFLINVPMGIIAWHYA